MSFRYYLYISDSKVDMLLPQIDPAFTRKRRSEVGLRLRIFDVTRSTESSAGADRTARLERVVRHLLDHGDLGSIDEPGQFFWGLLPLPWGPFDADPSLVYFGGCTDRTIVGLGGSISHVLGSALDPPHDRILRYSLTPWLLNGLGADPEIKTLFEAADREPEREHADRTALRAVQLADSNLRGPAQNAEFVAKRLLQRPSPYPDSHDISVLLGSPLYVALVD